MYLPDPSAAGFWVSEMQTAGIARSLSLQTQSLKNMDSYLNAESSHCVCPTTNTSSPRLSDSPPRALAHEGIEASLSSPLSTTSTAADGEASSPVIPPLPAPTLPERALELLRTPPRPDHTAEEGHYATTSWGSPYPHADSNHHRRLSFSSEPSDDSPLHLLEINTPFLRPAPSDSTTESLEPPSSLSGSAAVLANRARRPLGGITEDWIRQHTTGDDTSEPRLWFSDGGSAPDDGWFAEADPRTPRARRSALRPAQPPVSATRSHPRNRSSIETLRQAAFNRRAAERGNQDAASIHTIESVSEAVPKMETPNKSDQASASVNGSVKGPAAELEPPATPTPRLKKKVPWRGNKTIVVSIPRDEDRGRPGAMLRFDLEGDLAFSEPGYDSQSREEWPNADDIAGERSQRKYHVLLPDLNAWQRALGVTQAEDEPAPPPASASPAPNLSRQPSNQFTGSLPFSPPLPTPSATSNAPQGFPFPAPFLSGNTSSAAPSPGIPSGPSPISFNPPPGHGKFNPRASISISPHELPFHLSGQPSPHAWSPQMQLLQQQLGRTSPTSPFQREGMSPPLGLHQRHQSLQFPMMPRQHLQRQDSARASPRLQELREDEEETQTNPFGKSQSDTPEAKPLIRHNASDSLQREIDDAEREIDNADYHLEEQFRSQLEHEDYSPHNENEKVEASKPSIQPEIPNPSHVRGPSVHFSGLNNDSDEGPKLHHPQPHSRGHSLSQQPFFDNDEIRDSTDEGSFRRPQPDGQEKGDNSFEIDTNPSNLGTPNPAFDLVNQLHQRSFSTASNPWAEVESLSSSKMPSRRTSHASKPSFSKLNAGAMEFKFNPGTSSFNPGTSSFTPSQFGNPGASSFTPGQFVFGNKSAQPSQQPTFQPPSLPPGAPQSTTSSHFSMPSNSSSVRAKTNAPASTFSPGMSEFSFSSSGPRFNPAASAFQPTGSFAPSLASVGASGNESGDNRPRSIFGNIDLNVSSEYVKPVKKSKAIPIVRPTSEEPSTPSAAAASTAVAVEDQDGRVVDPGRSKKKFRENHGDGDDVPMFAEPTPEPEPAPIIDAEKAEKPAVTEATTEVRPEEDDMANAGDTTFASTILSESTDGKLQSESNDTKATTSPSATSPDPDQATWRPFEFGNEAEIQDFNNARPFGDDAPSFTAHEKNLSAAAKPFVPGNFMFGGETPVESTFDPVFNLQPAEMAQQSEESGDDRAGSPTPGPDSFPAHQPEVEQGSKRKSSSPEPTLRLPARGLGSSRFASPPPAPKGLRASRFAVSPSPPPEPVALPASQPAVSPSPVSDDIMRPPVAPEVDEAVEQISYEPLPISPPSDAGTKAEVGSPHEPTFEEIDAVMQQINENDPYMGVRRTVDSPQWQQPSPVRNIPALAVENSPALQLPPQVPFRSDEPSPSPRQYRTLPQEVAIPRPSTELEDPFLDPPRSALRALSQPFDAESPVHRLNVGESLPESDWDDAFSASEQGKLEQRVNYFDGHVNDLVGNLLDSRLDPLEKVLDGIQQALGHMSRRPASSRRDGRSLSAEIQESDADDEDEEMPARRSMSPRRDKRLEQIRMAVVEALNQQQTSRALQAAQVEPVIEAPPKEDSTILKALDEMREQFSQNLHLDFRGEDLRNIVEAAVESRMPPTPQPVIKDDEEANNKLAEMQAKILDLENRLSTEESRTESERSRVLDLEQKIRAEEERSENETMIRRGAEDRSAELKRQLDQAETKVEVEIMNRSVFDQRIHDLEDRLRVQEGRTEFELSGRREAEDRLSEIQRLLRISSEEEDRLRSVLDEREQKIKSVEQVSGQNSMRLAMLEAAQTSAEQTQAELKNRINMTEIDLRDSRQETRHWRAEADQARESAARQADDFVSSVNENKHLHRLIDTLGVQLEENERIRDTWRVKFVSLQESMAQAAREITEENSRRTKKEQALVARHEVLEARIQAEARTRERLEVECERLENGERAAMRAVSECKRLDGLLAELRNDNHNLHQQAMHAQRELKQAQDIATTDTQRAQQEMQAARDLAAAEIQQARLSVESELQIANQQVSFARAELEEEMVKVRAELDQVRMDADTAKAHHDMMLEEAQTTKLTEIDAARSAKQDALEDLSAKHQNEIEDLQARYERQINNTAEDAQRAEQNLLERLSLSTSKSEHLQDRVAHLEDKVQVAQQAAKAAAQAATQASKTVGVAEPTTYPAPVAQTKQLAQAMQLPEKISPQALRESIMVLQEQLQAREQRIEELEQTVSKLDPDAATKITKRDDEISWLRELLAVRHGDLQDIIVALSAEQYDREAVKDAVIRLKTNLQMEEQERERAMNGGSAINLPNIAATIQKAATPRVAQAVGPLAAAWGNWRKSNLGAAATSSPVPARHATPSRPSPAGSQNSFLSGLMTPPASNIRNTPQPGHSQSQPTAFGNTGRRFTAEQFANRSRGPAPTARQAEKMPLATTPPPRHGAGNPQTPPMMRTNSYDADAQVEEFDDASFYDD
ncbi:hypothetical protein GGR56DRAFT_665962 [Xylariaceae sp. FL0804]|nr:hypothetical protein GGR56DRAFT_665962 [Xylariaceae sp. FL0804]